MQHLPVDAGADERLHDIRVALNAGPGVRIMPRVGAGVCNRKQSVNVYSDIPATAACV